MTQFFCISCRSATDPDFKACPYCGEPITDFLRKYLREPIDGKYRIISRLGIGGMGEVYKVLHLHLNVPRVIKLMRPNLIDDDKAHWRFVREARLATKISHPNVAALYDFSEMEDGSWYMVWEYIEGITFSELIRDYQTLSPRHAVSLSIQALSGLHAIHKSGVVHRDISPENLMVTRDEEGDELVKIIDLGIAKQWDDSTDEKTKTGMFVGKWRYCSPEHLGLLKSGETIDGRADLYSYAIVLYQMLTGVPPFDAQTPHQFVVLHSTTPPPPLTENNPALAGQDELEAAISRGLEKDREKRFATARQFASSLRALLPDLPEETEEEQNQVLKKVESIRLRDALDEDDSISMPGTVPSALLPESGASSEHTAARATEHQTLGAPSPSTAETVQETPPPDHDVSSTIEPGSSAGSVPPEAPDDGRPFNQATFDGFSTRLPAGEPRPFDRETLATSTDEEERESQGPKTWLIAAVLLLAALATGAVLFFRGEPQTTEIPEPARPTAPESATLAVNAFPWATVEKIVNAETGEVVPAEGETTPVLIQLAPGRWEVTLASPSNGSETRIVELEPGTRQVLDVSLGAPDLPGYPTLRSSQ